MRFLNWIFGKNKKENSNTEYLRNTKYGSDIFTIGGPPGYCARIPLPKRRGISKEQRKLDDIEYNRLMRESFAKRGEFNLDRLLCTNVADKFIWKSNRESMRTCQIAKKNNGKIFSKHSLPEEGYPGNVPSCPNGWCNCYISPLVK